MLCDVLLVVGRLSRVGRQKFLESSGILFDLPNPSIACDSPNTEVEVFRVMYAKMPHPEAHTCRVLLARFDGHTAQPHVLREQCCEVTPASPKV